MDEFIAVVAAVVTVASLVLIYAALISSVRGPS
jgi:hypothetical protein